MRRANERLKTGEVQVVLRFPPDFGELAAASFAARLRRSGCRRRRAQEPRRARRGAKSSIPQPQLLFNSGKEKSRIAHVQVEHALNAWKSQIVRENLLASRVPANVAKPFELKPRDVAERRQQQALMWSKILPFVLFIWALTGAFYPAVDLCAGEKERGTLETLLSSPALRTRDRVGQAADGDDVQLRDGAAEPGEPGLHGALRRSRNCKICPRADVADGLDLPPLTSLLWLVVALVPMSALFSALCLACAAFARSTKEGQYYLMPLLLVTMPLMMLPMAPGAELNLGNSLIPVTGVVLLLMGLVQGNYAEALRYVVPVCVVTLVCCLWRFAGPCISSTRNRCCSARASGSICGGGSCTWCAIGRTRRRWPRRFSAWR